MAIINIKESYIKENYVPLNHLKKEKLNNQESNLYVNRKYVYKIIKKKFRTDREKNISNIYENQFPNAINIVDLLYDNNKFIGVTNYYYKNLITLKNYMNDLDLYEIKEIMEEFINFYQFALSKKMLYWDIHLNNIGVSDGKLFVCDIDSMDTNFNNTDIKYTLNSILTLFYELCYKESIRNNYDNYLEIISDISKSIGFLFHDMTFSEVEDIIMNTTQDYLEEKKYLLKKI